MDSILQLNGRELLTHAGAISHQMAIEKTSEEYDKYKEVTQKNQRFSSLNEIEADIKKLGNKP